MSNATFPADNTNGAHDDIPAPGGAGNTAAKSPWYLSCLLWTNLAALASMLLPAVRDWLASNPIELTSALGAVNVLLGFASSGRVRLTGAAPPSSESAGCASEACSACPTADECRDMGLNQFAEAPGGPDTDAKPASPSSIPTGAAGSSAIKTRVLLTIGALMILLGGACSKSATPASASVSLSDGQVIVVRGASSLALDRGNHQLIWTQSVPEVIIEPSVVQSTAK